MAESSERFRSSQERAGQWGPILGGYERLGCSPLVFAYVPVLGRNGDVDGRDVSLGLNVNQSPFPCRALAWHCLKKSEIRPVSRAYSLSQYWPF